MSIPVGVTTNATTYGGIFGYATIDMIFTVTCADGSYGTDCGLTCSENCNGNCITSPEKTLICATTPNTGTTVDGSNPNSAAIFVPTGFIVLILIIVIAIGLAIVYHVRRKKKKKQSVHDEHELYEHAVATTNSEVSLVSYCTEHS